MHQVNRGDYQQRDDDQPDQRARPGLFVTVFVGRLAQPESPVQEKVRA
jgi:hypothetical protein